MSKPSPKHEIIVHPIAGQIVRQRTRDTYIDATAMCQAAGKRLNNYLRADRTKRFVKALEAETRIRATELIQVEGLSPWLRERMMLRAFPLLEGPDKARAAL